MCAKLWIQGDDTNSLIGRHGSEAQAHELAVTIDETPMPRLRILITVPKHSSSRICRKDCCVSIKWQG